MPKLTLDKTWELCLFLKELERLNRKRLKGGK